MNIQIYGVKRKRKLSVEGNALWSELFMKEHIDLFKFSTFQINYDHEIKNTSRIGLLRQYESELSVIDGDVKVNDLIKNDAKVYEYCKIL